MDLGNFFMEYAKVTSIKPIGVEQVQTTTQDSYYFLGQKLPLWEVRGQIEFHGKELESTKVKPFCFVTPHVVLATGNSDQPRKMGVPGEDLPFVLHSLIELERLLSGSQLHDKSNNLVVVGAGLCAADAIIAAHFSGIHITHVFRRDVEDPELIFNNLPQNMYPEYHKVHQMMADTSGVLYSRYKSYPKHQLVQVLPNHTVILEHTTKKESKIVIDAAYVIVLIGMQPDLSFISNCSSELTVRPEEPINCRQNPIAINPYTHEMATYSGIFAMGPLVGDNFVRFVHGGALAISTYLHQKLKTFSHSE
ncbi:oxidative stress-induced growth inhibitor 1-like [Limulus polyphemus]|uniref:Oxidative stress-induced growth inhibitor 1-like n=1 Tax=Limulus polyphemus TaxID=6850 RepID=A0ABM1BZZ3_LIMPO|nr:oxidative stress-induced growth inhibitor 1-like [Limulus polyphemus]